MDGSWKLHLLRGLLEALQSRVAADVVSGLYHGQVLEVRILDIREHQLCSPAGNSLWPFSL